MKVQPLTETLVNRSFNYSLYREILATIKGSSAIAYKSLVNFTIYARTVSDCLNFAALRVPSYGYEIFSRIKPSLQDVENILYPEFKRPYIYYSEKEQKMQFICSIRIPLLLDIILKKT